MQSKWMGRIGLAALVMGVTAGSGTMTGCAAERDPINKVQLNAMPKSFFVGQKFSDPADDPEFYARSMVIDVPYGESGSDFLMFTNTVNKTTKIKWQITEDRLLGRVAYERIIGTDGKGVGVPETPSNPTRDPSKPLEQDNGVVVYAFNIEKQFDIRRGYNPQTGEENNIITENDTDRRWQDREYIRVDFSKNLVTTAYDFDTLSLLGIYNGIQYSPMEFDVQNPNDVNAPVLDIQNGYFDVTNKLFAEPKLLDLGGWKLPGCMLPNLIAGGTEPVGNCNPNEITVRHSFRRVVDNDYVPMDWDGLRFEAYGAFHQSERHAYDSNYGLRDSNWKRYIERYNVWERSHYYTNPEKMEGAVTCHTDDECLSIGAVQGMSRCDQYNHKCTLPYSDRVAKPIVWYYSDGSPDMYFDATREAAEEWDTAMRIAVSTAKYAECKRFQAQDDCGSVITGNYADEENALYLVKEINACKRGEVPGTAPADCDALADSLGAQRGYAQPVIDLAKAKPMVIVCHSPVAEADAPECGKRGTVARLGDLRFNLLTNVTGVETNSPWGIMSDASDPETGEKVATSVNVWTYVNDLFARGLVDVLRYIGGELKTSDITNGKYIEDWIGAAKQVNGAGFAPRMTKDEIDKRIASAAGTTVSKMRAASAKVANSKAAVGTSEARLHQALMGVMKRVSETRADISAQSFNAPLYEARANMVKNTPLEAQIATPAMQQLAQSSFGSVALDQATKTAATSIFQGMNPALRRHFQQVKEMNLAQRGACIMEFEATAPLGYVALGDVLQEKFGKFNPGDSLEVQRERADRMEDYIRRRAQYAVISHEMGHSIGLRHNFVSSSDAWNYRPQYWQLRTNDRANSENFCREDGSSDSAKCVGPRWVDTLTPNESKNMIQMFAQSSTMEYAGEPTQDMLGLGAYDFGAARMFYGDVATVYADPKFTTKNDAGLTAIQHQDEFGGLLGYKFGPTFSATYHYSQLDGRVGLIGECKPVDVNAFKPVTWNEEKDGVWNPVLDGHIVTNAQGKYTKCTQPEVDFVEWETLKDKDDKTHAIDASNRVRVPHGFASDRWADLGNIAVYRHDNGADVYELMHFWIAQKEMYHIFTDYRRGRTTFSLYGAFNRALRRYDEKMRDSAKAIALYVTLARDTVSQYGAGQTTDPAGFVADVLKQVAGPNTVASSIAFDYFAHLFSQPQAGEHGQIGADPNDTTLHSFDGTGFAGTGTVVLSVPNGVTGGFGDISLGGRPIENALADNKGRDYNADFTMNCGSYYEKAFTAMLLTESADNFISASRDDFVDPRFRAVSIADVFPDGFRRWLGNNLTDDNDIKGVYVRGVGSGTGPHPPALDENGFAKLGTTSWWPTSGIETCFPEGEKLTCRDPFDTSAVNNVGVGPVVDPQVGWEQQKFAMLFTLLYLPENQRQYWVDQMHIYELGKDADPGFDNRIEYHDPSGRVYVAQTFGTEVLYGKTVQKGIAARVLEYANELLQKSAVVTPVTQNGVTWYIPTLGPDGAPQYVQDGNPIDSCANGRDCTKLKNYTSVPALLREGMAWFGFTRIGGLKGVY